jgi:hypothetical protein
MPLGDKRSVAVCDGCSDHAVRFGAGSGILIWRKRFLACLCAQGVAVAAVA